MKKSSRDYRKSQRKKWKIIDCNPYLLRWSILLGNTTNNNIDNQIVK